MLITLLLSVSSVFAQNQLVATYDNTQIKATNAEIMGKNFSVTHERVSNSRDPHDASATYSCHSNFSLPIEHIQLEVGDEKFDAYAYLIATAESKDDGECTNPQLDSTLQLPFNVSIEIRNSKPAISFHDSNHRTINIYNNNTMYDQGTVEISNNGYGLFKVITAKAESETADLDYYSFKLGGEKMHIFALKHLVLSGAVYDPQLVDSFKLVLKHEPYPNEKE